MINQQQATTLDKLCPIHYYLYHSAISVTVCHESRGFHPEHSRIPADKIRGTVPTGPDSVEKLTDYLRTSISQHDLNGRAVVNCSF